MASQKNNGMAFEWAIGFELARQTGAKIIENPFSNSPKEAFENGIAESRRRSFLRAAEVAVKHILDKENVVYSSEFAGYVFFNSDAAGQSGDVRDVLLNFGERVVGISCKSNHEALKHSRLSGSLDFVKSWGLDSDGCSQEYWRRVNPLFSELKSIRKNSNATALWADLDQKPERFYWPLLDAWADEITRLCEISNPKSAEVCREMISYLIGRNDFYKVICHGAHTVNIQAYNFNGTLATRRTKYPETIISINKKMAAFTQRQLFLTMGTVSISEFIMQVAEWNHP